MTTFALFRTRIAGTTFLSRGLFPNMKRRDRFWVVPLVILGLLAGGGTLVFSVISNYFALARIGGSSGHPEIVLFAGQAAGWIFSFVMVFPLSISVLYLSRDSKLLATLPIPEWRIAAVNYLMLFAYTLPVQLLVFVPAAVVYLATHGATAFAVAALVIEAVTGPFVPLALAVLLVHLLSGVIGWNRHRMALEAIGMTLLVVALIGSQVLLSRSVISGMAGIPGLVIPASPAASGGQAASLPASTILSTFLAAESWIPPLRWAATGVTAGAAGTGYVALFVLLGLAANVVTVGVVRTGYSRQLSERSGTPTGRRRSKSGRRRTTQIVAASAASPSGPTISPARSLAGQGTGRPRPLLVAFLDRELSILTSNSSFLFESAGELMVFPLVLVVFALLIPPEVLGPVAPTLQSFRYRAPIALALLTLMSALNTVSASSVSREGSRISLSLSLPIPGRVQLAGKFAAYFLLFYSAFVVNVVIASVIVRLAAGEVLMLLACGVPLLSMLFLVMVQADLRRPLLDWNHPQQAMKQNMNVLIAMGLGYVAILAVAAVPALFAVRGAPPALILVSIFVIAAGGTLLLCRPVMRYADRRYAETFGTAG